jgi:homoserine dehydrogenase
MECRSLERTAHWRQKEIVSPLRSRQSLRLLMQQVRLGIIGGGTVGGGVVQALQRNGALMASRLGVELKLARVAVRDLKKKRPVNMAAKLLTTVWQSVVRDPQIDLVAELVGGRTLALYVVM